MDTYYASRCPFCCNSHDIDADHDKWYLRFKRRLNDLLANVGVHTATETRLGGRIKTNALQCLFEDGKSARIGMQRACKALVLIRDDFTFHATE